MRREPPSEEEEEEDLPLTTLRLTCRSPLMTYHEPRETVVTSRSAYLSPSIRGLPLSSPAQKGSLESATRSGPSSAPKVFLVASAEFGGPCEPEVSTGVISDRPASCPPRRFPGPMQ